MDCMMYGRGAGWCAAGCMGGAGWAAGCIGEGLDGLQDA